MESRANLRVHAGLRCRPSQRIDADRAAMLALPRVLPDVAWRHDLRLGADHWVRFDTNDYSVHPRAIGPPGAHPRRRGLGDRHRRRDVVARHARVLAKHQTVTDPEHDRACRARARLQQLPLDGDEHWVQQRDLAAYDRALGVAS